MDLASLVAGIPWDFETFPEYLVVGRTARHHCSTSPSTSATRRCGFYVMGDEAVGRAATAEEIAAWPPSSARPWTPARPGSPPASP